MSDPPFLPICAAPGDLLRLRQGIAAAGATPISLDEKVEVRFGFTDGSALVAFSIPGYARDHLEAFTLGLHPIDSWDVDLGWTVRMQPWPQRSWTVEVLQRLEWSLTLPADPSQWADLLFPPPAPGEIPPGAEALALSSVGLLFTGDGGERQLLGLGDMPMWLKWTDDPARIDDYLADCFRLPLGDDAAALASPAA